MSLRACRSDLYQRRRSGQLLQLLPVQEGSPLLLPKVGLVPPCAECRSAPSGGGSPSMPPLTPPLYLLILPPGATRSFGIGGHGCRDTPQCMSVVLLDLRIGSLRRVGACASFSRSQRVLHACNSHPGWERLPVALPKPRRKRLGVALLRPWRELPPCAWEAGDVRQGQAVLLRSARSKQQLSDVSRGRVDVHLGHCLLRLAHSRAAARNREPR